MPSKFILRSPFLLPLSLLPSQVNQAKGEVLAKLTEVGAGDLAAAKDAKKASAYMDDTEGPPAWVQEVSKQGTRDETREQLAVKHRKEPC